MVRLAHSADLRSRLRYVSSAPSVAYTTGCSRVVTHPGTNPARRCLTSVIRREPVCHRRLAADVHPACDRYVSQNIQDRCCFWDICGPAQRVALFLRMLKVWGFVRANGHTMPKEDLRPRDSSGLNMALFKFRI